MVSLNARVHQLVCVAAMAAACGYLATRLSMTPRSETLWVSARPVGRLGNQLFIAAAASGIAKRRGARVCVRFDEWADKEIFRSVIWLVRQCGRRVRFEHTGENGRFGRYLPEVVDSHPNESIMLDGNFQSFRYWNNSAPPFRLRASQWARAWIRQRGIRVGVHVRRGDYLTSAEHIGKTPPLSYYASALARVNATAESVLVCTDDPDWVEQQPLFRGAHVSRGFSPGQDMALLSECDDLVLSTGTFGWWAGYFKQNRGTVHFYFKSDHHVAQGRFVFSDHFPANWVADRAAV